MDWIGYDIRKLSSFKKILYSNFHGVGEKRQSREKSGVIITLDFFLFCLIFPFNVKLTVSPMHFVMIQVEKNVILEQLESSIFPYVGINGNHLTVFVSSKLNSCQSFWPIDLILVSKCLELHYRFFWLFEFFCRDYIFWAMRKKLFNFTKF